jgi:hypothetical protein
MSKEGSRPQGTSPAAQLRSAVLLLRLEIPCWTLDIASLDAMALPCPLDSLYFPLPLGYNISCTPEKASSGV